MLRFVAIIRVHVFNDDVTVYSPPRLTSSRHHAYLRYSFLCTLIKKRENFPHMLGNRMGAVAKSCVRKGFLKYEETRK
jgi:hypothetical protein